MDKPRKVAYAVFEGHQPGVYSTWAQAEQQVKGFPNNKCKGYTDGNGGRVRALKDYRQYIESKQLADAQLQTIPKTQTLRNEEWPPSLQTEKNGSGKIQCTDDNCLPSDRSASQIGHHNTAIPYGSIVQSNKGSIPKVLGEEDSTTSWRKPLPVPASSDDTSSGSSSSTESNASDSMSQDTVKAHVALQVLLEQGSSDEDMVSDEDSQQSTDYGDLPQDFDVKTEWEGDPKRGQWSGHSVPVEESGVPRTEPELCDEQLELVDLVMSRRNVFYTGSAGCGKSTVLRHFVAQLKARGLRVQIIAPTGRAALEVGGITLYSYAGWTPSSLKKPMETLKANAHKTRTWKRMDNTDVLIIDEISMVENQILERLNRVMKDALGSDRPFGGVQVIVTGDFCQLPPVKPFRFCMECGEEFRRTSGVKWYICEEHGKFDDREKWAFCSDAWKECKFVHFNLNRVHRQKDVVFKKLLEQCRVGRPLDEGENALLLDHNCDTTGAVKLFPTREQVARVNEAEMERLKGRSLKFNSLDNFWWNSDHAEFEYMSERSLGSHTLWALEEHRFDAVLELKENMLVILLVNLDLDAGLVNGSQGVIIGFQTHNDYTVPEVYGDYKDRRRGLVKAFINRVHVQEWPIVQFQGGARRTIYPHCMMSELGDKPPYSLLSRTQIPLLAAWAITIHKSQGMTLSRVIVDLSRTFEKGQAYVALSRARSLEGLKVEALSERNWGCNQEVLQFLEGLIGSSDRTLQDGIGETRFY